jgi:hypothetical protein
MTADFSYAGSSLSNSGEQVRLVNAGGTTIDDLTYDDADPWPVAPDGSGPSLEFDDNDWSQDNALPLNWHASAAAYGTPRAANSAAPIDVKNVTATPAQPVVGQPVTVSATAPVGSTLTLTYKVMYGADQQTAMADGNSDGVYEATIPAGAGAGALVRYKIAASRPGRTGSYPPPGDSRPYDGVVVRDPALDQAKFPVLQWFMPDDVYTDMVTNHRCDGVDANATFAWDGRVLDGGAMHIKGHTSCSDPKAKWDVELPAGYFFSLPSFPYPVKSFDLQNEAIPRPRLGWEMIGQSGEETAAYQTMRIQRNGSFHGVFGVLENYDSVWRDKHGYKDAAFYKVEAGGLRTYPTVAQLVASGDLDKKNPDDGDYTDIWTLTQQLAQPNSPAKQAWMRANFDLTQMANYTALTVAMRHWDSGSKNYDIVKNPQTGRWQILSWDLDGILSAGTDPKGDFVFPSTTGSKLWQSLFDMTDFRAMHYRRVRTLHDRFLATDQLVQRFDQLTAGTDSDINLDKAKWTGPNLATGRKKVVDGVAERRQQIAAHTNATEIPTSQSATAAAVINEIQYRPGAGGAEYLEVFNPATTAVDMSGWALGGLDTTADPGSVIPAKGYATWVKNDASFKTAYGGNSIMLGQYQGALDAAGETVAITDGARSVDTVTYSPSWAPSTNGGGPSLELVDPASDNSQAASWAASTAANGTPGAANSVSGPVTPGDQTVLPFGSTWRYLATGPDQGTAWRASGFDDSSWASGAGALGFASIQNTAIPRQTGRLTYYFRGGYSIGAGNPVTGVTLNLKRDDGAVVYVDGVEVARVNMPGGTVGFSTKATSSIGTAQAQTPVTVALPTAAAAVGTHVVAVEMHQYTAGTSSDLLFDAKIDVTR